MSDAPIIIPDAVYGPSDDESDQLDLAALLGPFAALVPPELLDVLGQLAPDPDAVTLEQLDESVSELHDKLDRALAQLAALCDVIEQLGSAFSGPLAKAGVAFALRRVEL